MTGINEIEWGESYQQPQLFFHPEISSGVLQFAQEVAQGFTNGTISTTPPDGLVLTTRIITSRCIEPFDQYVNRHERETNGRRFAFFNAGVPHGQNTFNDLLRGIGYDERYIQSLAQRACHFCFVILPQIPRGAREASWQNVVESAWPYISPSVSIDDVLHTVTGRQLQDVFPSPGNFAFHSTLEQIAGVTGISSLFDGRKVTPNGITEIIASNDFIHNQPYAKIIMSPR